MPRKCRRLLTSTLDPPQRSPSPQWQQRQKHIPKGAFCSFYRKWQLYRHIYTTRDRRAKGDVRPSLVAQVGREGSSVGKGVAHSGTSCHTARRLKKTNVRITRKKKKREQRKGEGEKVRCGDLLLPQPSHGVGSFCGWDTDVYTLGIPLGGGCASSREQGWRGWLGLSSPFTSLYQQEEGCGIFPGLLEGEEII